MGRFRLELSVDTVDDAVAADSVGADRIELCSAGALGGLTPSPGALAETLARVRAAEVHVLVRPRDGGFRYTPAEVATMVGDVTHAVGAGATGVVVGALTPENDPDVPVLTELIAAAQGRPVTLHRAVDVCRAPAAAVRTAAGLGIARVLSSGQAVRAEDGAALLAELVRVAAAGRLDVMACGGVRPHNALAVLAATGVSDLHAAPRTVVAGPSSAVDYGGHATLDAAAARALADLRTG
ncbi:MAG TPA: copper homeostasis protein CutC [Pseudonocardiaceae bacterium]|jgi:copper homeostasis protein|nr:copper homeostasis protein CutC [Pseudonocardiaceae bacterium]